jgi:hypothetical protein
MPSDDKPNVTQIISQIGHQMNLLLLQLINLTNNITEYTINEEQIEYVGVL